jgi:ferric-dicitrate binding protein FerR (iron transport regulator)
MRTLSTAFLILALAMVLGASLTAAPKREPAGVVISVSGKVSLYASSGAVAKAAAKAAEATPVAPHLGFAGDRIKTGANGRAALVLTDGTQLKLNYSTDITLRGKNSKGHSSARGIAAIKIFIGQLWAKVTKKDSTLEFDTPSAVAAVKGTEPLITVSADGSVCVQLRSGKVRMSNGLSGGATLNPNQQICVSPGEKITASMVQAWNAAQTTWEQGFNQASQATVTVNYVDQGGAAKTLVLNYAAGPATGSAQSLTGSAK